MDEATQARLAKSLDLVVNSAGLTDFNPDLREALASNVDSTIYLMDYLRQCDRAGLMHLSTCYVVGMRDGRVGEELLDNYNPAGDPEFDAEREIESLREMIRRVQERSESPELTKALRRQALGRGGDDSAVPAAELGRRVEAQSRAMVAESTGARGHAAGAASRLAEYVHFHQEPGRIDIVAARARLGGRGGAAVDRGEFDAIAVCRVE